MDPVLLRDFAIALMIGALVGLEREHRDASEPEHRIGGLRTFTLFALAGAVSAWLSRELGTPWIFIATTLGVTALVLAGYVVLVRSGQAGPGLTTEIAAVAVTLLGGVTMYGHPQVAVALGVVVSVLLAFKKPLHGLVGRMGEDDLLAGLKLLVASFIILPLLPNRPLDPLGALNPAKLWLLVVLISGLSLAGYVAVRVLGDRVGTSLTAALGGLASSTAVTLSFSRRSQDGGAQEPLAGGILLAWVVMFARVLIVVAILRPALAWDLLAPLGAMVAVTAGVAWATLRGQAPGDRGDGIGLRNPFSLTEAVKVALAFAAVLLLVKVVERYLPGVGVYPVAVLAGLTDMDAITLSMVQFVGDGGVEQTAVRAIVLAAMANTVVKGGMVAFLGTPPLRRRVLLATALIVGVGVVAFVLLG